MAENSLQYRITIDAEKATATIKNLNDEVIKTDLSLSDLDSEMKNVGGSLNVTEKEIYDNVKALQKLRSETAIGSKKYQEYTNGINTIQKSLTGASRASGAMTSSALELGRVISDAPYGIRGMANNLSQLASNIFFSAKQTGSFKKALGGLLSSLTGPVGLLIAFQSVIAIIESLNNTKKKAEESTKSLADQVTELTKKYYELIRATKEYNDTAFKGNIEARVKARLETTKQVENIRSLVRLATDESLSNIKRGNALEKLTKISNKYFSSLDLNRVEDIKRAEDEVVKILRNKANLKNELVNLESLELKLATLRGKENKEFTDIRDIEETKKRIEASKLTIDALNKQDLELNEKRGRNSKKLREKEVKDLELSLLDMQSIRDKFNRKEVQTLEEQETLELNIAKRKADEFFKKEEEKTNKYKEELNKRLDSETSSSARDKINEKIKKADEDLAKVRLNTYTEYEKTKTSINDFYLNERKKREDKQAEEDLKRIDKLTNDISKIQSQQRDRPNIFDLRIDLANLREQLSKAKDEYKSYADSTAEESVKALEAKKKVEEINLAIKKTESQLSQALMERLQIYQQGFNEVFGSLSDFINGEYDRQMTIEENHTNNLNNELRKRLNNENLSVSERKKIQSEIARNDEKLRRKQEKIEKERFETNKVAGIANATVNTYLAASQVLADDKLPTFLKPFMVATTIASGLLQVATIARQKFQSSAGAQTPISSGAGGGGDREFNFNLAGASTDNAIANAIGTTLNKPIQAYVVSEDITSQQELDLNIKNSSIVGG